MGLTKSDIVNELASIGKGTIFSRRESTELVESLLQIIKQTLESGEDVLISRFGKFCVRDKKRRPGRNPNTGESAIIDARRVVTFHCSDMLRDKINGKNVRWRTI
jgi:integration host factor subunit alpha